MKTRRQIRRSVLAIALCAAALTAACTTTPATGEKDFTLISPEQEKQIGAEQHPKILAAYGGAYDDPALGAYVAEVTGRIAKVSELAELTFTVTVLDTPAVNAFALPGGYVYVTRGLIALANDEAELAGVIGHEIAHVTARHSARRQTAAAGPAILGAILGIVVGDRSLGQLVQLGGQGFLADYSRDQEREADMIGTRYLAAAGYDPAAQADFLMSLGVQSAFHAKLSNRQYDPTRVDWLSSHPAVAERAAAVRTYADGLGGGAGARNAPAYFRAVDGMVYGDSPRHGFIRGRTFVHPELRFTFTAPPSFRLVNTADAVLAQGPDNAVAKFDADKKSERRDILAYLSEDWGGQVRLEQPERFEVGGMAAATAVTRARKFNMRLVAVEFAPDRVYRFLIGTPPQMGDRLDAALREMVMSFRRISESEAQSATPLRVRAITVRPGDTVESLAARMTFADYREERFRVLNSLAPGERLQAGRTVKIVTD